MEKTEKKGIRFSMQYRDKYSKDEKVAFLDQDELEALISSMKKIESEIFPNIPTNYTEVCFISRGGMEAGCFYSDNTWKTFFKLEKYDKDSYVWLSQKDFIAIIKILENAQKHL